MSWKKSGQDPDYRFSLANERTYLAWIRTSLAILAGAVAINQLSLKFALPNTKLFLSVGLCCFSALMSSWAYFRWAQNEQAMRNEKSLNYTRMMKVISLLFSLLAIFLTFFLVLD